MTTKRSAQVPFPEDEKDHEDKDETLGSKHTEAFAALLPDSLAYGLRIPVHPSVVSAPLPPRFLLSARRAPLGSPENSEGFRVPRRITSEIRENHLWNPTKNSKHG
jgi:hypothetical protein